MKVSHRLLQPIQKVAIWSDNWNCKEADTDEIGSFFLEGLREGRNPSNITKAQERQNKVFKNYSQKEQDWILTCGMQEGL